MRFLAIAAAAMLLMLPVTAQACGASAKAASVEFAAAKKKPVKVAKKTAKPKVEYMRAAPM